MMDWYSSDYSMMKAQGLWHTQETLEFRFQLFDSIGNITEPPVPPFSHLESEDNENELKRVKARFAEGLLSCATKDGGVGQVEKVGGRGNGMGEEEAY